MTTHPTDTQVKETIEMLGQAGRTLTLSQAINEALHAGVVATIESVERTKVAAQTIELNSVELPALVTVQAESGARITAERRRQIDEDAFESVALIPIQVVLYVLVLRGFGREAEVPLVDGDRAAVLTYGWRESSVGQRAEVRVFSGELARALDEIGGGATAVAQAS